MGACPPAAQGGTKPRAGQSRLGGDPGGDPVPAGVEGMETPSRESWGVPRPWGRRGVQGVPEVRGWGVQGGQRSLVQHSPAVRCACLRHHLVLKGGMSRNSGQNGRKNTVL